jgi:hypothetical protein
MSIFLLTFVANFRMSVFSPRTFPPPLFAAFFGFLLGGDRFFVCALLARLSAIG